MLEKEKRDQFLALFIVLIMFLVYANSFSNGTVSNDNVVIRNNPLLSGSLLSLFNFIMS